MFGIGSLLGGYFALQVGTGVLLSLNYVAYDFTAIETILDVTTESFYGSLLRLLHGAGAGLLFAIMYPHMSKFVIIRTLNWLALTTGLVILIETIASAFLGYVLVWQQMSYWAATVITSLISVAPDGSEILNAVWGNFTLDRVTLTRFYSFHYMATIIASLTAVVHLLSLHIIGNTGGPMV